MSEDMKTLLEEEEKNSPEIREHEVVKGKVVLVNKSEAFIDIGYKQEIPVPKKELAYPEPDSAEDVVSVGSFFRCFFKSASQADRVLGAVNRISSLYITKDGSR